MHLILKNLIALSSVLLVISHGIIQFGMFELFQANNRADITEMMLQGIPVQKQVILVFDKKEFSKSIPGLQWIDQNEFRYNDRMFDIINKEVKGDSIYLHCIDDSIESDLYTILDKLIEDDTEDPDEHGGLNNFFSHYYSNSETDISFLNTQSNSYYYEFCHNDLLEGEHLLNTPPPQV